MPKDPVRQTGRHSPTTQPFTRRHFLSTSLKAGAAAFTAGLLPKLETSAQGKPYNVLFIAIDDLRPLLGCYGYSEMHTPNIDTLAGRGTLFNRAYCQFPVCNPSRASVLTGLRPDTVGVPDNFANFRDTVPEAVTLPQHFKAHGYHTRSVGKITHGPNALLDPHSWSAPIWREFWKPVNKATNPSWQALDVADNELEDGRIADAAVGVLREIKDRKFFLAVGFNKPHLPFYAPSKYFDLYPPQTFSVPVDSSLPQDAPNIASNPKGLKGYQDISKYPPFDDEKTLELIRAYAATTSYMDAQVGHVLKQLDTLGLTENTVVVLWGDHGFHLGEHGLWRKNTLFEDSVRSPLIVSVPGQTSANAKTDALVELIDIYPTLCDVCQLTIPQLEGISLMPVIEQPTRPWKTAAFSQLARGSNIHGYSIRTQRYRYTEWGQNGSRGVELYDYEANPDETVNIAGLPENAELVAHLSERLQAGWRAALPDIRQQVPVPQTLPWDVNNDGVVDIRDLVLISSSFGEETPAHPKADVNMDGKVNILDLLLVAVHFGESSTPASPSTRANISAEHFDLVEQWLTEARLANDGSLPFQNGIAALERLISTAVPKETVLLANYPNPFNPETWIPYDLAEDSEVKIHIYNLKGESVRRLSFGFQNAGTYRTRSRAAYWDGRNAVGEPAASGVYFYSLHAGEIKSTRHMVILK
ncbi:sulfatase-like hydrolase/transferase [Candidatus Poribacteria bacterium]|nr:sulfatase-like hydrolase/transferase [Candidatus Poribacteria bacterium]